MLKQLFPVWAPALALLFAVVFLPACQKESLLNPTDVALSSLSAADRGPGDTLTGDFHRHRHHHDSLGHNDPLDSLHHHLDSLHHAHLDSLHHHLDSLHIGGHGNHHPLDSTHIGGGGHHPHDSTTTTGCHVKPVVIAVTDLPAAAQAWLTANAAGADIKSVLKVTRPDCTIEYVVRIKGKQLIRFDANGNKK